MKELILMELRTVFDSSRNFKEKQKLDIEEVNPVLQSAEPKIFKEPWIVLVLLDVRGTL